MEEVPEYLKFTQEDIEENARKQAELRSRYGIGTNHRNRTPGQQTIEYYERQVLLSTDNLNRLISESTNPEGIAAEQNRLAVSYMYLGKFDDALHFVVDDLVRDRIKRIKAAVERDDEEVCTCPPTVHQDARGSTSLDPRINSGEYVFSPKHGKIMPVRICAKCGDLQIGGRAPARTDDSKHRDQRMAALLAKTGRRR